jgi:23S rRNA (pseudouridine1915-N3)-methyltransferase
MKFELWCINKSSQPYVIDGINDFTKRIKHYLNFDIQYWDVKTNARLGMEQLKKKEAALLLSKIKPGDHLILLDEHGKEYRSTEFAKKLEKLKMSSNKRIIFIVGGGYGFDNELRSKSHHIISLSKMTFPHDLVRVIFLEQLYRACTIQRGEKYHHE